jgi:cytochrome c-type biogenesis protein CcmF
VGPPAFTPFVVPLALILVLLSGVGPMIAWRRVTAANLRRNFTFPVIAGVVALIAVLVLTDAGRKPFAVAMFALGAFVIAGVIQELVRGTGARRALTGDAWPVALGGLVRRNRRRYGGYTVHLGVAVLLIGVAASSSFQHSRDVLLKPGQSAMVDGYRFTYVRPTEAALPSKLKFGAVLSVSRSGRHVLTVNTSRGYYPNASGDGVIGRFFSGQADSTVGLHAGVTQDIWTVVNPGDLATTPLARLVNQGDRDFGNLLTSAMPKLARLSRSQQNAFLSRFYQARDVAVSEIARRYVTHPWPVEFLLIVSPLVTWIWIGAMIIAAGGLIALWPVPVLVRRRSPFAFRVRRLAREPAKA